MPEKKKFDFGVMIEKHKFLIGGGLILLIAIGLGWMLWRENYQKPSQEDKLKSLEARVNQLEQQKIDKSETAPRTSLEQNSAEKTNPNSQTEQGQVAGASNQTSWIPDQVGNDKKVTEETKGKVNINTASAAELESLSGIGPTYAQRIVDYRNTNGGFKNIEEVKNVKGIGEKTFDKFKDQITI